MAFSGWPEEALDFYDGLAADNTKTYWAKHKAVYTDQILAPMTELTEELAAEFGEPKIFRPYRDIRFSKDKTPYKTHIGAVIGEVGYVQLSAEGLGAGAGMWEMNPEQLARYRAGGGQRPARPRARADRRRAGAGRHHRARARRAQVRAARLPGRPPSHRAAPLQGADRLAAVARRGLAGKCPGQGPRDVLSSERPGLFAPGSPSTSGADDAIAALAGITTGRRGRWAGADGTGCPVLPRPAGAPAHSAARSSSPARSRSPGPPGPGTRTAPPDSVLPGSVLPGSVLVAWLWPIRSISAFSSTISAAVGDSAITAEKMNPRLPRPMMSGSRKPDALAVSAVLTTRPGRRPAHVPRPCPCSACR